MAAAIDTNNVPTGTVSISGNPSHGETLFLNENIEDADGLGHLSYRWMKNGNPIEGAVGQSYDVIGSDVGNHISVSVSYTDNGGTEETVTSETVQATPSETISLIDDDGNLWDSIIDLGDGTYIKATDAQLYRTYYGALGRLPDEPGYNWWLNQIKDGRHTLNSMADGFIYSNEFKLLADSNDDGSTSNEEFITHMYNGVFGRLPDADGFSWWVSELDSGSKTQAEAFIEMTQSNEYVEQTYGIVSDMLFY